VWTPNAGAEDASDRLLSLGEDPRRSGARAAASGEDDDDEAELEDGDEA
jgi:hypothetical protein